MPTFWQEKVKINAAGCWMDEPCCWGITRVTGLKKKETIQPVEKKKSYLRTHEKKKSLKKRKGEENTAGESVANEVAISFEVFSFSLD